MNGTKNDNFHTVVIGAGPGGTAAAKILAGAGKRVALVSQDLGGECVNFGCIPTKVYLYAAEMLEKISSAQKIGVEINSARLDWQKMKQRKTEIVAKLKKNLDYSLRRAGAEIIEGKADLIDKNSIRISTKTGERTIKTDFIIIAAGSRAIFPPGFPRNENILTNHEILDIPDVPKTLLIIGGGAIGVEFASVFSALGSKVTILEGGDRLLPYADYEISAELERIFTRKNIEILKNTLASFEQTKKYEKTLVAIGREPAVESLALEKAGINYSSKGIETNKSMQTNIPNIYAVGDIAGKAFLAYTAEREGRIAAQSILGIKSESLNYDAVPNATFCHPEAASVGISEQDAKQNSTKYLCGKSLFSSNSKALICDTRDGFAKIIIEKNSRKILGVHIIGEKASELIAEAALAITTGLTADQFAANLHGHPVLSEVLKEACEEAFTKSG